MSRRRKPPTGPFDTLIGMAGLAVLLGLGSLCSDSPQVPERPPESAYDRRARIRRECVQLIEDDPMTKAFPKMSDWTYEQVFQQCLDMKDSSDWAYGGR